MQVVKGVHALRSEVQNNEEVDTDTTHTIKVGRTKGCCDIQETQKPNTRKDGCCVNAHAPLHGSRVCRKVRDRNES